MLQTGKSLSPNSNYCSVIEKIHYYTIHVIYMYKCNHKIRVSYFHLGKLIFESLTRLGEWLPIALSHLQEHLSLTSESMPSILQLSYQCLLAATKVCQNI